MNAGSFDAPILPPYKAPSRHWDLNAKGRPTGTIGKSRRRAEFVAAVPGTVGETQPEMLDLDNLTDEKYLTSLYYPSYYAAPRSASLKLRFRG